MRYYLKVKESTQKAWWFVTASGCNRLRIYAIPFDDLAKAIAAAQSIEFQPGITGEAKVVRSDGRTAWRPAPLLCRLSQLRKFDRFRVTQPIGQGLGPGPDVYLKDRRCGRFAYCFAADEHGHRLGGPLLLRSDSLVERVDG